MGMPQDPYRWIAGFYALCVDPANAALNAVGRGLWPPRAGMRVLDVGCGTGEGLKPYRAAGCRVWGIDSSPAMLARACRKLGPEAGLGRADGARLPFPGGTFHLVRAVLALHEMPPGRRPEVLAEMARVLTADGRLLVIEHHPGDTRCLKGLWSKAGALAVERAAGREHFRHYRDFIRRGGITALLPAAGLEVERQRLMAQGHLIVCLARAAQRGARPWEELA